MTVRPVPPELRKLALELDHKLPNWHVSRREGLTVFGPYVILCDEEFHAAPTARIDSFTKFECGQGLYLGEFVHIASFCHIGIGGGLTILEDGVACSSGAKIISGTNVPARGRGCSAIDPRSVIERSYVHVKREAIVFAGAIVLPGVTVGENAVIAAGAVVNRNVPPFEVWAGKPARKIGEVKP